MLIRMSGKQHLQQPNFQLNLGRVGVEKFDSDCDVDMAKIIAGAVNQRFSRNHAP